MIKIANNVFIPQTMALIGSVDNGSPNFMAAAWVSRVNTAPAMFGAAIGRSHATHDLILKNNAFSLCIPGRELLVKTDYAGLVSGTKADKSNLFKVFYRENQFAPLIKDSIVSMELKLVESVKLPMNTLFIGQLSGAWCNEEYIADNLPDYQKGGSFILTMPDNFYRELGQCIGKAWSDGLEMKK